MKAAIAFEKKDLFEVMHTFLCRLVLEFTL